MNKRLVSKEKEKEAIELGNDISKLEDNLKRTAEIKNTLTKYNKLLISVTAREKGISKIESAKLLGYSEEDYINMFTEQKKEQCINFDNIKDHFDYLKDKDGFGYTYKDGKYYAGERYDGLYRIIYPIDANGRYYHGTTLKKAKQIIKDRYFYSNKKINDHRYNKIYFSELKDVAITYAKIKSLAELKSYNSIVFEVEVDGYETYANSNKDMFVWGNMPIDCIKHIYLIEDEKVTKEISKEELLKMEV